ncbi:ribosome small subunit-dependent GTPase A [Cellulomonas gelida]|uniref:Small ribosomal subunit biogenesis GTPase RsgA n=1 Tax=Cellulomonas gelida TaxID=1712 RepID=A0A4Y3KN09_9CELL|nr:ribosome small subunit-dependent GTPase A [Cellulomonas gelida]GEA84298.1 putative ribosome biogenesis GTPase RsgA [Cellulomonas gelida]GGL32606.1 putative ribosome biogenesis GTPase RsgA [Cellulomonas gelida]
MTSGQWRVVRAERTAVLVVPAGPSGDPGDVRGGATEAAHAHLAGDGLAGGDARASSPEPLPAGLARDGLADSDEGRTAVAVGDLVELDPESGLVATVLPRRSALVRDTAGRTSHVQVLAANVDVVLVVEHLDPDPDLGRVERLLTLAWRSGAQPVVVLTKADLVPDPHGMAQDVAAAALAVDVHAVSAATGEGLDPVRALLGPGVTLVVVGPSGAGKSTLVNALAGREIMATGERRQDGRGRHTTTHRELVPLPSGAMLIDTPGLRAVGLVADADALDHTFADVAELAARCKFADCSHVSEPGCAVLAALDRGELDQRRFASWRKLEREAAYQERRVDARLAAPEKARWKRITQEYHRGHRGAGAPRP